MALPKPQTLCRYRYDPLDRLANCLPSEQADTRCFYRQDKLTTEIQGSLHTSWLRAQDQLLAQRQSEAGKNEYVLLATDAPGSVLHALGGDQSQALTYVPYGTRTPHKTPLHLPGFNGERLDPVTGHYLLGNGYRAYNPVLMRFNSPDSLSPFGEGGLNAYAAFRGTPINSIDPDGHAPFPVSMTLLRATSQFKRGLRTMKRARQAVLMDSARPPAKRLINAQPDDYLRFISDFKPQRHLDRLDMTLVTHKYDLEKLTGPDYKFIFTDQHELIIGNHNNTYFPHPVLTYLSSRDSRVISAGHLASRDGKIIVSTYTGHYFNSAQGVDTSAPVLNHIEKLGAEARLIRQGVRGNKIPLFYKH